MKKIMDTIRQAARSLLWGCRESGRVTAEYAVGVVVVIGAGIAVSRFPIGPTNVAGLGRKLFHFVEWLFGLVRTWTGWW